MNQFELITENGSIIIAENTRDFKMKVLKNNVVSKAVNTALISAVINRDFDKQLFEILDLEKDQEDFTKWDEQLFRDATKFYCANVLQSPYYFTIIPTQPQLIPYMDFN